MNLKQGRKAGKGIALMLAVSLLCSLLSAVPVHAAGEGNMDGGGGGMGQGTSQNKWTPGYDGVRVSVVRASDHSVVTTPIDLTNKTIPGSVYHFGKVSKLQYSGGAGLSPVQGGYNYTNPSQALPRIVSSSGAAISPPSRAISRTSRWCAVLRT